MIVNCAVYRQGQKLADIPVADISDYVTAAGLFRLGGRPRSR